MENIAYNRKAPTAKMKAARYRLGQASLRGWSEVVEESPTRPSSVSQQRVINLPCPQSILSPAGWVFGGENSVLQAAAVGNFALVRNISYDGSKNEDYAERGAGNLSFCRFR